MLYKFSIFVVLVGIVGLADSAASNYFQICHRSDANLTQCVKETLEHLLYDFKIGMPELELPSIEPLLMEKISFKGDSDKKGLISNLTKVEIWGLPNTKINNITTKLTKRSLVIQMKLQIPTLRIEGIYFMNSKILFLRLKGSGFIQINATNVLTEFRLKAHRIQRDGEEYLEFEKMTGTMDLANPVVSLQGFFRDPTLNKATNDLVSENFKLLFEDIKPSVLDALFTYFTELANKATKKFTLDELFPK